MIASDELSQVIRAAWAEYGAGRFAEAAAQLQQSQSRFPDSDEVAYALGMLEARAGRPDQARRWFERAVELLGRDVQSARGMMLRRFAKGHLNRLERGTWDLEAEIWQHDG